MDKKIKTKCPECGKEIKITLRFGQTSYAGYADTIRKCPHCGWFFGIISYGVA